MEDLTTGPLTRHLFKTTSFMLVTMIFQTLYFRIDLYWVCRLGTHAVAAGCNSRQRHVYRARPDTDAWRRHDDRRVARGRKKEPRGCAG